MTSLLKDSRNIRFLEGLGHQTHEIDHYISYFANALAEGKMPHEIGLFFGYPLKDVMGFMGHSNLKKTTTFTWQVYGDPRLSIQVFKDFQDAERVLREELETVYPKILLTA